MVAMFTPAASISSAPTLVGTPVMTNAPVMIDSIARSSVRSAVMLAKLSTRRPNGATAARHDQLCVRVSTARCATTRKAATPRNM
ncbi:hypothetical protein D3C83_03030 [compost metagenome]